MGNNHSNKPKQVEGILASQINSNNNSNIKSSNDEFNKWDRQNIQTIKKDLSANPELFVLNNMLMSVMFFENYPKLIEDLRKDLLTKREDYVTPDLIFEKVNQNILYRPHHGPKKKQSEPLVPKRIFVFNDWVKVIGSTEEVDHNSDRTIVRIEESRKKGYVRLRTINTYEHNSGSPILRIDTTEPNSRSSTDSSDNYYSELQDLKTPKPIEIIRQLEKHESSTFQSGLPKSCLSYRQIKKKSWDEDESKGLEMTEDDLFETVSYINSKSFIEQLQNNLFLNGVASKLGIDLEVNDSRIKQEKFCCSIQEGEASVPCEIIPSIQADWPLEQTLKFVMKKHRLPEPRKRFIFPTPSMIDDITTLGCVLLPKGQLRKIGDQKNFDIEWELNFPHAQRYLETFMNHCQMKGLLILMTLHKTFVEPKTSHYGLTVEHIRNFVLKECESNYSEWPEHCLGTKLLQLLTNLNEHLSKAKPNIPDFFIPDKNILSDVSTPKVRDAQNAFHDVLQTPVMHFMKALRNLRYIHGENFFPSFEFQKLHDILKKSGLVNFNPQIPKRPVRMQDTENLLEQLGEARRRREREEQQKKSDERRGSVDSIDLDWNCEKKFDIYKIRALLKFFIETFLGISEKCLNISSNSTPIYIKQAYYLTWILLDECPAFKDDVSEYLDRIKELERLYETKRVKRVVNGAEKTVQFAQKPQVTTTNGITNHQRNTQNAQNGSRKSVTFVEVHKNPN